ncbi:MAG: threonine--tRNA ligase [bacterium]
MAKMQKKETIDEVRHSLSHLMSMAILERYPKTGLGVGPIIDNGFYQDYDPEKPLSESDFSWIEKRMRELIKKDIKFTKKKEDFKSALAFYKNDPYKTELINDLKVAGEKDLSFYDSGWYHNLCKGPHVKSTKEINPQAFKLTKVAGDYWRGDEKRPMLQRIYGIAFEIKEELDEYLKKQEEAEKRDHRRLGKEMELFLIDPSVGMGLVLWQPKGAMLWRVMEDFWYQEHLKNGYQLVRSPHIGSRKLWETSGHWGFYNESMYPAIEVGQTLKDAQEGKTAKIKDEYLLKPMNCPFHVTLYNSTPRSYRELPIRWAECGTVYRYEKSGELSGLTRVRGFTQDDAHIICTKDQVKIELKRVADFILYILKTFGFTEFNVYLSLRDPKNKEKYAGNDEGWRFTQKILEDVAKEQGLKYIRQEGEAAFYGPKLDYKIKDCLGREWQCSTLQFDFNLPERFDMNFTNDKGQKERPYVLHRALFGSFERFIGILIEHYAGAFPVWLAPVQALIIPITDKQLSYSRKINDSLLKAGIRSEFNDKPESMSRKIRDGEMKKIPYLIIIGDKEQKAKTISVRSRNRDLGTMKPEKLIAQIITVINKKKTV